VAQAEDGLIRQAVDAVVIPAAIDTGLGLGALAAAEAVNSRSNVS